MKTGDLVKIVSTYWSHRVGGPGIIIAPAKRIRTTAFKVMVVGDIYEFDQDELELINEN